MLQTSTFERLIVCLIRLIKSDFKLVDIIVTQLGGKKSQWGTQRKGSSVLMLMQKRFVLETTGCHLTLRKSMRAECGFLPACVSISKGKKDTLTPF